ncbi:MAG TPA: hypothetical protein PK297_10420 [Spirochaetota bacterium]|nr:hypothetical protein [Spirochaetota bacterium]
MNKITEYVTNRMREIGLGRADLARRIGYGNIHSGMNSIDKFLAGWLDHPFVAPRIAAALEVSDDVVRERIAATQKDFDDEAARLRAEQIERERANHRPYLWAVMFPSRPKQITIYAMIGGDRRWRVLILPDGFNDMDADGQREAIRARIAAYVTQYNDEIFCFGKIKHFVLSRSYDEPWEDRTAWDLQGNLMPEASLEDRCISVGVSSLKVKGRPLNIRIE